MKKLLITLLLIFIIPAFAGHPYLNKVVYINTSFKIKKPPLRQFLVTSKFGMRNGRLHKGIDLAAKSGDYIYSVASGKVTRSGWLSGYGNVVDIDHGNGYMTRYAHNSKNKVEKGDIIQAGQIIALVGATGRASGPHVHFEVRKNGKAQNPEIYYNF